jgi:hypothetical protein
MLARSGATVRSLRRLPFFLTATTITFNNPDKSFAPAAGALVGLSRSQNPLVANGASNAERTALTRGLGRD